MQVNVMRRCGEPCCHRLGAPSCDYCALPVLKRLEDIRRDAETQAEEGFIRRRNDGPSVPHPTTATP